MPVKAILMPSRSRHNRIWFHSVRGRDESDASRQADIPRTLREVIDADTPQGLSASRDEVLPDATQS